MSLQYEVGENCDARCTYHPQGTIYNSKQRDEAIQDGDKKIRKVNQKENIYRFLRAGKVLFRNLVVKLNRINNGNSNNLFKVRKSDSV